MDEHESEPRAEFGLSDYIFDVGPKSIEAVEMLIDGETDPELIVQSLVSDMQDYDPNARMLMDSLVTNWDLHYQPIRENWFKNGFSRFYNVFLHEGQENVVPLPIFDDSFLKAHLTRIRGYKTVEAYYKPRLKIFNKNESLRVYAADCISEDEIDDLKDRKVFRLGALSVYDAALSQLKLDEACGEHELSSELEGAPVLPDEIDRLREIIGRI
jgi:hypothetical protein